MGNKVDYSAAFQLHGKVAIVTGAGGNLGAEMCAALSAAPSTLLVKFVCGHSDRGNYSGPRNTLHR